LLLDSIRAHSFDIYNKPTNLIQIECEHGVKSEISLDTSSGVEIL